MEWIGVKDRLPGENEDVLIWSMSGIHLVTFWTDNNGIDRWTEEGNFTISMPSVMFWMPLPKPPHSV